MSKILQGIGASDGIAISKVYSLVEPDLNFTETSIDSSASAEEVQKFKDSIHKTKVEITKIRNHAEEAVGPEHAAIFDAHLLVLEDPELITPIEEKINDRTKAILLSNPGNPTGAVYTQEEVKMIADIALKHNLYILADEVYREFIFDDQEYLSFGSLDEVKDRVIIIDSISKRFSACGARIGCVASKNKEIMAAMVKLATVRLAAPTIEMVGATALYNLGEEYFDEIKEIYQSRRDCIYEELNKIEGVTSNRAGGAFYTIANLPVDDAEDFCIWLLEEFEVDGKTLMMAPAAGFYEHADDHKSEVRIAFILNNDDLKEAMRILDAGLKAYNNR